MSILSFASQGSRKRDLVASFTPQFGSSTGNLRRHLPSRFAAFLMLCFVSIGGAASAQTAILNSAGVAEDVGLQANDTADVTINNVGTVPGGDPFNGATFQFNGQVTGAAEWAGGVQFQSPGGLEQIWTQIDTSQIGTSNGNYQMVFSRPVDGLTFFHGGLDVGDTVIVTAFNGSTPVPLPASYFADFTGGVAIESSTANSVQFRSDASGDSDERENEYSITFPTGVFVDQVRFETGKPAAPLNSGNSTYAYYLFSWNSAINATNDTIAVTDTTSDVIFPNVVTNDSFNGDLDPAIDEDVTVNVSSIAQNGTTLGLDMLPTEGAITLDPNDGSVTVATGTTAGTYVYTYEICEVDNVTNCDTAEVTIVVSPNDLIAVIEEDLTDILEEDLVNTLTHQSNRISTYSSDAANNLRARSHDSCLADVNAHLIAEDILFDTDKAIIRPESDGTLDAIAAILNSCSASAFEIAGHTDSDASDAYNIDLSQRRVTAVLQALAARGLDTTDYAARGYGEREPIASNATAAGKQQNRRVEFRPLTAADSDNGHCDDSAHLTRTLNAQTTDSGTTMDGQFMSDQHDCATDRRTIFEGSLSYLDTDQGQTQSALNLSYRREQYQGSDSVFGYFIGLYASQSDVSRLADGEIKGLGVNAGIYGANRFENDLFLDYYLAAATGRHKFDLTFDESIGSISATGDYQYVAGFAGAALSGKVALGETTVMPRAGFDYVYSPGADVDVVAELGNLSQSGNLELSSVSGGRVFAEVQADYQIRDGLATLWVTPRLACYQSLGGLDGVCGYGGAIGLESTAGQNGLIYAAEVDGEWGEDYTMGSLTLSAEYALGNGVISADASLTSRSNVTLGGNYEVKF